MPTSPPWTVTNCGVDALIRGAWNVFICRASHDNAPLIAAAPLLRDALLAFVNQEGTRSEREEKARAALDAAGVVT